MSYISFNGKPKPSTETSSHYQYEEGNWRYSGIGNVRVFAYEDEGSSVTIHVAEKRRYAIVEPMEELTYDNLQGAFSV